MKNLLKQIAKIDNSVDLNVVIDAIKAQRKIINNAKIAKAKNSLSAGMKVRVNGKRTGGQIGIIKQIKIKRAIVEIEGRSWDCPLSILEAA